MDENLIIRRNDLRKKLLHLEWDKRLNQINFARDMELKGYRLELEKIEKEIIGGHNDEII